MLYYLTSDILELANVEDVMQIMYMFPPLKNLPIETKTTSEL